MFMFFLSCCLFVFVGYFFFFKQKTAYEMRISDWSSDVCSSDLGLLIALMNLGGRLIPDDATGWLGFVRKICKLVGLYASNRITSKLTVNKIAETTVPIVNELGEQIGTVEIGRAHV